MLMTENILNELKNVTDDLLQTINLFTEEQFNVVPFERSWTAAQVVQHLVKSELKTIQIFGAGAVITQRKFDEHAEAIKSIFLNFTTKLPSPEFTIPSNNKDEKSVAYNNLKSGRDEILKIAESVDLSRTFKDFQFPQFGALTGME